MEELKKILMLGVGAAATTYEKSSELIDELVKKGRITIDEGKELGEELKRTFKEKTADSLNSKSIKSELTKEEVLKIIAEYKFVSRAEYDDLKERVEVLEAADK